jgi:hypothetical protein
MGRMVMRDMSIRGLSGVFLGLMVLFGCTDRKVEEPPSPKAGTPASSAPTTLPEVLDSAAIGQRLGAPVTPVEGGGLRAVLPRTDLAFAVDGVPASRSLRLGTDVMFQPFGTGAVLSGDVAVFEDEVSPVLDTLLAHGVYASGLYSPFSMDEPRVELLRFVGSGNVALLASAVQSIGASLRDVRHLAPKPASSLPGDAPVRGLLDANAIGGVIGADAVADDGEVRVQLARAVGGTPAAAPVEPLLQAVFAGSDLHAAVDGHFGLSEKELLGAEVALRRGNLHLVALTPCRFESSPACFAVYFRGKGTSLALVRALSQMLDTLKGSPS